MRDGTEPHTAAAHDTDGLRRRALLAMGAAAGATLAVPFSGAGTARAAAPDTGGAGFARAFAEPPHAVRPRFRWWWPDGLVDIREVEREVDQIADAGFGGVEIAAVTHSMTEQIDVERHGWGTPAWVAALEAALRQAARRRLVVDLTVGPAWPAAVPTVAPDDPAAASELAHGVAVVEGGQTFAGPLPAALAPPAEGVTAQHARYVQAARVAAGGSPADSPVVLDPDTVTDLAGGVEDGRLTWTAPAGGVWLVIAYWERGSGQRPEGPPHTAPLSYVVDHLGAAGTRAVVGFWEEHILTPSVRALLRATGGALFEDSLELETDATLWTPGVPAAFERHTGYALPPYLAAVVEYDEDPVFSFGKDVDTAVRRDYMDVVTELYIEHHLKPLRDWAHALGLALRVQPYGLETDAMYAAALLDVPEGESLGFKNLDDFRCLAGGRDMGGRRVLSNEAGATAGGAYATTWDDTLKKLVTQYAAGVNQAVFHGFAYARAPRAGWPGFAAFSPYHGAPGYGEAWGPRQPGWRHVPELARALARMQHVLQTGVNRADVGVLRQKGYAGSGLGAPWFSAEGVPVGWTHLFLSPRLLTLPGADVRHGRLAPEGPAFKALVVEGDVMNGRERTMELHVAEKLLGYAKAGLPVVVIGDWSDGHVPGLPRPGANERLRRLLAELLVQPTVARVPDRPDVPQALAALGVRRDVEYAEASVLLHAHRAGTADDAADYFFFANDAVSRKGSDGTPVDHDVVLTARRPDAVPYRLDAWTGTIEPLAVHRREGDRIRLRIALAPGATTIVALARPGSWGTRAAAGRHAVRTEAADVRWTGDGRLEVREHRPGSYATELADGRTVTAVIGPMPEPVPLTRWELRAEDWRPGATPTDTVRERRTLRLDGLAPWPELPELADSSGVGRYRTTVRLGSPWTGGHGALLELGEVSDTFRVTVNGWELPPADQVTGTVDVGDRLRRGVNTIEVEVATTLLNRLRVARPEVFGAARPQSCGLVGPVRLVPYGRAVFPAVRP
jgi:hypothetical protein